MFILKKYSIRNTVGLDWHKTTGVARKVKHSKKLLTKNKCNIYLNPPKSLKIINYSLVPNKRGGLHEVEKYCKMH